MNKKMDRKTVIMNNKKIIRTLFTCILFVMVISCSKENNFIPLLISNLKIEGINREDYEKVFKAEYKDTQTLECIFVNRCVATEELKITGVGAYYDGKINLYLTTNTAWIEEGEINLVPFRISFELHGAGLNRQKCDFTITLNGEIMTFEVK